MNPITLEQAVTTIIADLVARNVSFSAHEVTGAVRTQVNAQAIEIAGIPFGYVDSNNTHSQMITHCDVRAIVADVASNLGLQNRFTSGGYRVYSGPAQMAIADPFNQPGTNESRIALLVANQFGADLKTISRNTNFVNDLNADDLDMVELGMSVEEEFDLDINDPENFATVGDIVDFIPKAVPAPAPAPAPTPAVAPQVTIPVPQRFVSNGVNDIAKKKVTRYVRRKLNKGDPITLRGIQKATKSHLTVVEIEQVVKAEGWKVDTTPHARSLYTVNS